MGFKYASAKWTYVSKHIQTKTVEIVFLYGAATTDGSATTVNHY